jgi:formamidopyrimidine-DNA glycosylase
VASLVDRHPCVMTFPSSRAAPTALGRGGRLTGSLSDDEVARLHAATGQVLREWIDRLRAESADRFPEKVTAFRPDFAVHGRYGQPCPVCGTAVARIVHGENETDYCPRCQTGGRLLADHALSRLLRSDWPRTVDELETRRSGGRTSAT